MTPEDKAKQLVDSYTRKLPPPNECEKIDYPVFKQGKLIATMVVDEILSINKAKPHKEFNGYDVIMNNDAIRFWNFVRDEIEVI